MPYLILEWIILSRSFNVFNNLFLVLYMWGYTYGCSSGKSSEALELESQAVVSDLKWVLGTELGASARTVRALSS